MPILFSWPTALCLGWYDTDEGHAQSAAALPAAKKPAEVLQFQATLSTHLHERVDSARQQGYTQWRLWTQDESRCGLLFFPPYAPELNPSERLWRDLKDWLAHY